MVDTVITVKLQRGEGTSWGFRLAGGKDFGYPLSVQRVNPGSLAEKGGLQTGDALLSIQGKSTDQMRHKEAQDAIMRAGNYLELQVQRGASMTWKPKVTPVGSMPKPSPMSNGGPAPVTKTSLAANKQPYKPVGTGHNTAAKPFGGTMQAVVHNQYNSPMPVYSANNIADTLSAQTEVLTSGAVGINFMKGDKPLNKESAVYRMVLEEDKHPKGDESDLISVSETRTQSLAFRKLLAALGDDDDCLRSSSHDVTDFSSGGSSSPAPCGPSPVAASSPTPAPMVNLRHVEAPKTAPAPPAGQPNTSVGAPNTCADCGRLIVGVFVRIKDRALHAECFRCATCGTSLKNIGYFNIKDKLYCDIHAKQAARHIAPGSNLEPVPVPPGGHIPQGVPLAPAPAPAPVPVAPRAPAGGAVSSPMYTPPAPKFTPAAPYTPTQAAPAAHSPVAAAPLADQPPPPPDSPGICYDSPVAMGRSDFRPASTHSPMAGSKPQTPQSAKTTPPFGGMTPLHPVTAPVADAHRPIPAAPEPPAPYTNGIGNGHAHEEPELEDLLECLSQGAGSRPAPKRGRGKLTQAIGGKIPICSSCGSPIRGPFVTALGRNWCPDHFLCSNGSCRKSLQDIGFVEEQGKLYCEHCYECYMAPICRKCGHRIKGDCLNALEQTWHPDCFVCTYCKTAFGNSSFYLEDGMPYCEKDWNELFTTKCVGCGFPIEAGDRWVEALNNNYHSQCFKCTICQKNLEGQSFFAKGGRPFCKAHAR
ncbi:PDZ and LIM domain protein Zasp-like isoform X3 [Dermacentor silvarum]|uniref:PDZ and LIM domain protein Zasp-like isoform X3 n=1 Tax=Dermacentor silvarum TaxID=543639 RepID=UPI001897ED72|nr:PDZ and LIM domain protein Zasp-like isoform X3 [Dermacentor silvarum]